MKRRQKREPKHCPIDDCTYISTTFIDLLRHMVESERNKLNPLGHQEWLQEALGAEFADYAFKKDRRIADLFAKYCRETGDVLPGEPQEFYTWFKEKSEKPKPKRRK